MALVLVSSLRNFLNQAFTKATYIITSLISIGVMSLCVFLASLSSTKFYRVYSQFYYILTTYDSAIAVLNCTIFCLMTSLFLEEIVKKNLLYDARKSEQTKEKLAEDKKKVMVDVIKHLYQDQDNMESSVEEIVCNSMDVNRLKIDRFLTIKKEEDNLKFLSLSVGKSRITFMKLLSVLSAFYLTIFILDIAFLRAEFNPVQVTLIIGFVFSLLSLIIFLKRE